MCGGSRYRHNALATVVMATIMTAAVMAPGPWLTPALADPGKPTVEFAWDGQFFLGQLPHGEEFLIEIALPVGQEFASAHIWKADGASCADRPRDAQGVSFQPLSQPLAGSAARAAAADKPENRVVIHAPDLQYSTAYCFRFKAIERLTPDDIAALRRAVEDLVVRMSPDNLRDAARRRDFLHRALGPLGDKKWRDATGQLVPLLDWVARRAEDDPAFERTRQAFDDESQARVRVADQVSKLRQLEVPDPGTAFGKQSSAVTAALKQRTSLIALAETNQFYRRDRSALDESGDDLSSAGQALQNTARQLESTAKEARTLACSSDKSGLPALERERAALDAEVRALDSEVTTLDAQLGAAPDQPGAERKRKARDKARAGRDRKRAEQSALKARSDARATLCDRLRDMEGYGRRLARDLDRQRERGRQRAELVRQFRARVQTMSDVEFPIEIVHGDAPIDPTYTERAGFYISGDVGVAYPYFSPGNIGASLFVGVSFHFTAVDKDIPLGQHDSLAKRCSLVAGVTITGVRDDADTVRGVAGDQAFLGGLGCRLTDYLRVAAGGALFRQRDPNPAIDREPLRIAPYVALSVDSDVIGLIKDLLSRGR